MWHISRLSYLGFPEPHSSSTGCALNLGVKMRHIFSLILCLSLAVSGMGGSGTKDDPWQVGYPRRSDVRAVLEAGVLSIEGTGAMQDWNNDSPPWCNSNFTTVEIGDDVTYIGAYSFSNARKIVEVRIGNGVASIGNAAFNGCSSLIEIELPVSVCSIGNNSFAYCDLLRSVSLSPSLTNIANWAFSNCKSLIRVDVPGSVKVIGSGAFTACESLQEIVLREGLEEIGNYAFQVCTRLDGVSLPTTLKRMNGNSFGNCMSLRSIHIPKDMVYPMNGGFYGCDSLESITVDWQNEYYTTINGFLCSKNGDGWTLHAIPGTVMDVIVPENVVSIANSAMNSCNNLESVYIPSSVRYIGSYAFSSCNKLREVTICEGVQTIWDSAFSDCGSLQVINIPASVTTIDRAFVRCSGLLDINVAESNLCYSSTSGVLLNRNGDELLAYPSGRSGDVIWPESVRKIGVGAFEDNANLTEVAIPSAITNIANSAFSYCENLERVSLSSSLESVGDGAFQGCYKLGVMVFPVGLRSLGQWVLSNCPMRYVRFEGARPETEGGEVFAWLDTLKQIFISESGEGWEGLTEWQGKPLVRYSGGRMEFELTESMSAVYDDGILTIDGTGEMPNWDSAIETPWYSFSSLVTNVNIASGVESIGDHAFAQFDEIKQIRIPEGVRRIGDYAFYQCRKLKSVEIPETVTQIGYGAFEECTSLEALHLPDSLVELQWGLVWGCESLVAIYIPNSIDFGQIDLSGCPSLMTVELASDNPNYISEDGVVYDREKSTVFYVCKGLESVSVPEGVTKIASSAFNGCTFLSQVELPESLREIEDYAFGGCTELHDLTIPDRVTGIGFGILNDTGWYEEQPNGFLVKDECLVGCKGPFPLEFEVPYGVRVLGKCFQSWDAPPIQNVYIPGTVKCISPNCFSSVQTLKSVYVEEGVEEIGTYAFAWCRALESISLPSSVKSIGYGIVYGCDNLRSFSVEGGNPVLSSSGGVVFDRVNKTILFVDKSARQISIPEGVTYINSTETFAGCAEVESLILPSTLNSIWGGAFNGCPKLSSITVSSANPRFRSQDGMVLSKDGKSLVYTPPAMSNVVVPEGVSTIDGGAFFGVTTLVSIQFPSTLIRINAQAFDGCASLSSFSIPSNVQVIGQRAFDGTAWWNAQPDGAVVKDGWLLGIKGGVTDVVVEGCEKFVDYPFQWNANLTSVVLPDTLTEIPSYMFAGCTSLSSVSLPNGLKTISSYAFMDCESLATIRFPAELEEIGYCAFSGCRSLGALALPRSLKRIAYNAFEGCFGVKALSLPESLESMDEGALAGLSGLKAVVVAANNPNFALKDGVLYSSDMKRLIRATAGIDTVRIPDTVEWIDQGAFGGCVALKEVDLPSGMFSIPDRLFAGCSSLESVGLPEGLYGIGYYAFADCRKLENLMVPSSVGYVSEGAFDGTPFLENKEDGVVIIGGVVMGYKGECPEDVVLPDGVIRIREEAFAHCDTIKSVYMPDSIVEIGFGAFEGCPCLERVRLPENDATISLGYTFMGCTALGAIEIPKCINEVYESFADCSSLTNVTIHDGLTYLGYRSFAGCVALESVALPNTVRGIYDEAFANCVVLKTVEIPDGVESLSQIAFAGCNDVFDFATSPGLVMVDGWILGAEDGFELDFLELPEGVRGLADCAFRNRLDLMMASIPGSVRSIPNSAFSGCENLMLVEIGEGVNQIGWSAFADCFNLVEVNIPDSVSFIHGGAFFGTALLDSSAPGFVTVDQCVIGYQGLFPKLLMMPEDVRLYAEDWNYDGIMPERSDAVEKAVFPATADMITSNTLEACFNLKKVEVNNPDAAIHSQAFLFCTNLASVVMMAKKPGYHFTGWKSESGKTEFVTWPAAYYYDGSVSYELPDPQKEDYWLYPVWAEGEGPTPEDELREALDDPNLDWTTGGDSGWFAQDDETFDGVSAARSGNVGNAKSSTLTTIVDGPGTLTFIWKISCQQNKDKLTFSVDGEGRSVITGEQDWTSVSVVIDGEGSHELVWAYLKAKSGSAGEDCGWLDCVSWRPSPAGEISLPEALGASNLVWETTGDADWYGLNSDGVRFARSGEIADDQQSILSTVVYGGGKFSFRWRVSSEADYDELYLFVNEDKIVRWISGETEWKTIELTFDEGTTNTLAWVYFKDEADSTGDDCGYVADVVWKPNSHGAKPPVYEEGSEHYGSFCDWLSSVTGMPIESIGSAEDIAAVAQMTSAKGRPVWEDFVLGTDPTDEKSQFKLKIEIVDNEPVITWEPELTPEEAAKRKYTVYGCTELGGEWIPVDEASVDVKALLRFFKAGVEMKSSDR